jgi:hypothetical protein
MNHVNFLSASVLMYSNPAKAGPFLKTSPVISTALEL